MTWIKAVIDVRTQEEKEYALGKPLREVKEAMQRLINKHYKYMNTYYRTLRYNNHDIERIDEADGEFTKAMNIRSYMEERIDDVTNPPELQKIYEDTLEIMHNDEDKILSKTYSMY